MDALTASERAPRAADRRPARVLVADAHPALPLQRGGPASTPATGRCPHRPAPPRPRRVGDGRARPRRHDTVIGVAFDGTGYGTDGAVWGGEVLVADYKAFRRVAHLAYVAAGRRRRERAASLPDGAGPPVRRRRRVGSTTSRRCAACPADRARRAGPPARHRAGRACPRPAWADSSTRCASLVGRPAPVRLRGRGRDRARGARPRGAGRRPYAFGFAARPRRRAVARDRPGARRPGGRRRRVRRGGPAAVIAARVPQPVSRLWSPTSPTASGARTGLDVVVARRRRVPERACCSPGCSAPARTTVSACCGRGCSRPTTAASPSDRSWSAASG